VRTIFEVLRPTLCFSKLLQLFYFEKWKVRDGQTTNGMQRLMQPQGGRIIKGIILT